MANTTNLALTWSSAAAALTDSHDDHDRPVIEVSPMLPLFAHEIAG
jgi:hypothetical protein